MSPRLKRQFYKLLKLFRARSLGKKLSPAGRSYNAYSLDVDKMNKADF